MSPWLRILMKKKIKTIIKGRKEKEIGGIRFNKKSSSPEYGTCLEH